MTDKLFYKDVRGSEFEAEVKSCNQVKDHFEIVLDRTYFYPEGGGQPADNGTLKDANVFDVQYKDAEIVHYTDKALNVGDTVKGVLDMKRRHRLMQQHSGEHIVSGIIHRKFGYDNVGFHMGSECITIDFNGPLTEKDLIEVEHEANKAIYEDFEPHIYYPDAKELNELAYRSKKELEGDIRIAAFGGYDTCACCGLHVVRTGEIGIIKITGFQKYKGGTRVTMLSGAQALEDYDVKDKLVNNISKLFSSKQYEIDIAVQRLMNERNEIKEQLVEAKKKLFEIKRDMIDNSLNCAVLFEENIEPFEIRLLAEMVMEKVPSVAVLSGNDEDGYKYAIGSNVKDVMAFVKEANKALNGRGGGRENMVQGSFFAKACEIESYIKNELA